MRRQDEVFSLVFSYMATPVADAVSRSNTHHYLRKILAISAAKPTGARNSRRNNQKSAELCHMWPIRLRNGVGRTFPERRTTKELPGGQANRKSVNDPLWQSQQVNKSAATTDELAKSRIDVAQHSGRQACAREPGGGKCRSRSVTASPTRMTINSHRPTYGHPRPYVGPGWPYIWKNKR